MRQSLRDSEQVQSRARGWLRDWDRRKNPWRHETIDDDDDDGDDDNDNDNGGDDDAMTRGGGGSGGGGDSGDTVGKGRKIATASLTEFSDDSDVDDDDGDGSGGGGGGRREGGNKGDVTTVLAAPPGRQNNHRQADDAGTGREFDDVIMDDEEIEAEAEAAGEELLEAQADAVNQLDRATDDVAAANEALRAKLQETLRARESMSEQDVKIMQLDRRLHRARADNAALRKALDAKQVRAVQLSRWLVG